MISKTVSDPSKELVLRHLGWRVRQIQSTITEEAPTICVVAVFSLETKLFARFRSGETIMSSSWKPKETIKFG